MAVSNVEKLASSLQSDLCKRINYRTDKFSSHREICKGGRVTYYKTGHFTVQSSVARLLENLGVQFDPKDLLDPSAIVFDLKLDLKKTEECFSHNAENCSLQTDMYRFPWE